MKPKIGKIEQEEKKCRAAFARFPDAKWAWCCHHEVHCELLTEPFGNRIAYILGEKQHSQQAIRLRNFRPVKDADAVAPARKVYYDAVAPARKVYDDALDTALKVYDDAVDTARKVYDDAVDTAHKVYYDALDPAS